ncbi:hypothetical protein CC86DRAFT_370409 [Ophiobolus disseminans]|uniref:SPT23/MGA2-like DNA-binding domain-containing protein n=1 Tax=Ophiobolus disseminans TaxID=1469910 RepID=A0A6A7A118_9PLEO|nr:hypothetical protein CC86DRAFT_370409 [Ophiobolus disseminans]
MAYSSQLGNDYVNPADLFSPYDAYGTTTDPMTKTELDSLETTFVSGNIDDWSNSNDLNSGSHQDSAVDLMNYYNNLGYPRVKTEESDFDSFFQTHNSTPASNPSNTPSPHGDMIFSNANSPGEYPRDLSQTSSPEASSDVKPPVDHDWDFRDDSIMIPQSVDSPKVTIFVDKTKTRAETQIKTSLVLEPLPRQYQWIRFPRHTLSKSKQLATTDEVDANEEGDAAVRLELTLVCATAVEKEVGLDRALRRARGEEVLPRRPRGTQVSEVDKEDPAHPQNGGAVVICEGCKERERKRYDRKKKRNQEEENEWTNYEDDRIIMINEKEFKRWQDAEQVPQHGRDAKKVEFAMRITCYCRHQEEKSPVGYKVIFTFRNTNNTVIAQKVSEIIQITDDHKNRELPVVESITTDLSIHPPNRQEMLPTQYATPMYNYAAPSYGPIYSQPTTPILSQFQSPLSPMDGQYSQSATPILSSQQPHQSAFTFNAGPIAAPTPISTYVNHQRYQSYTNLNSSITTPMLSPTEQFAAQSGYPLHRPHSMDSFATAFAGLYSQPNQNQYPQNFASQPPSRNVSRPASPSWEQGSSRTKKLRAVPGFFMVEDPDHE